MVRIHKQKINSIQIIDWKKEAKIFFKVVLKNRQLNFERTYTKTFNNSNKDWGASKTERIELDLNDKIIFECHVILILFYHNPISYE